MLSDHIPALDRLRRAGHPTAAAAMVATADLVERGGAIAAALAQYEARRETRIPVPYAEIQAVAAGLAGLVDTYYGELDFPPELFLDARDAQELLHRLNPLRAAFAEQTTLSGRDDDATRRTGDPLVPYTLRSGDTLYRLAQQYLGSIDRTLEIVELNGLVHPFLDTHRAPLDRGGVADGVKVTGEVILLPSDATVPGKEATFTADDVALYGRDWVIAGGVVQVLVSGELQTVEGVDNMVQALTQRVATGQGELVLHPEYGMRYPLAVGVEGTTAYITMSGLEMARTVAQDPRVVSVQDLALAFRDTANYATMRVLLIGPGSRTLPLNLVMPE